MNDLIPRVRAPFDPILAAFQSGTGGCGASTLAWSVGCELLRRGKSVLIVDADLQSPAQSLNYGDAGMSFVPSRALAEDEEIDWQSSVLRTQRDRPELLPLGASRAAPMLRPSWRASQLISQLRTAPYDYVLVDLPPGASPLWTSVFALSDAPVLVTTTEPTAVHGCTAVLRHALVYGMLHHPEAPQHERALIAAVEEVPFDADRSVLEHICRAPALARMLGETLDRLSAYLVVTQVRDAAEASLGDALALAWGFLLGTRPRALTSVGWDPDRWFLTRTSAEVGLELRGEAEGHVRSVANQLLNLRDVDLKAPRGRFTGEEAGRALLGVAPTLGARDSRLRYRELWEGFRRESVLTRSLIDSHLRDAVLSQLEDAGRAVGREPDATLAVGGQGVTPAPAATRAAAPAVELEQARLATGLSRRELSLRTRVGLRYIEALCDYEVEHLPREVYLRGYLLELARAVGIDDLEFVDRYVDAVHDDRQKKRISPT